MVSLFLFTFSVSFTASYVSQYYFTLYIQFCLLLLSLFSMPTQCSRTNGHVSKDPAFPASRLLSDMLVFPFYFSSVTNLLLETHETNSISPQFASRYSLWNHQFLKHFLLHLSVSHSTRNGSFSNLPSSVCTFRRSRAYPTLSKPSEVSTDSTLRESHLHPFGDRAFGLVEC